MATSNQLMTSSVSYCLGTGSIHAANCIGHLPISTVNASGFHTLQTRQHNQLWLPLQASKCWPSGLIFLSSAPKRLEPLPPSRLCLCLSSTRWLSLAALTEPLLASFLGLPSLTPIGNALHMPWPIGHRRMIHSCLRHIAIAICNARCNATVKLIINCALSHYERNFMPTLADRTLLSSRGAC